MAMGKWVSEGQIELGSETAILSVLFGLFSGRLEAVERREIASTVDKSSFRC